MIRSRLIPAVAAMMMLAACAPQIAAPGGVIAIADKAELESTRALAVAEIGYQAAARAAIAAIQAGRIRGTNAVAVRNVNARATQILIEAKAALSAGARAAQVGRLLAATAELNLFAAPFVEVAK